MGKTSFEVAVELETLAALPLDEEKLPSQLQEYAEFVLELEERASKAEQDLQKWKANGPYNLRRVVEEVDALDAEWNPEEEPHNAKSRHAKYVELLYDAADGLAELLRETSIQKDRIQNLEKALTGAEHELAKEAPAKREALDKLTAKIENIQFMSAGWKRYAREQKLVVSAISEAFDGVGQQLALAKNRIEDLEADRYDRNLWGEISSR